MTAPAVSAPTLAELIVRIAQALRGGDDAAVRAEVAADVERLRQAFADTAPRVPVTPPGAPSAIDPRQVGDALRLLAVWLREPSSANEAVAQRAIDDLQAAVGPLVGSDPARDDAQRRQQYRQEARTALDDYFRDRSRKP